jgi:hypothetical protein
MPLEATTLPEVYKVLSVNGLTGAVEIPIPTKISDLENDSDFQDSEEVDDAIDAKIVTHNNSEIAHEALFDEKVNITDIVDNLTSTDANKPLSAKQGKQLNDTKLSSVPAATASTFGGIKAPARTTENLKVAIDSSTGEAYAPTPNSVDFSLRTTHLYSNSILSGETIAAGSFVMQSNASGQWYKIETVTDFDIGAKIGHTLNAGTSGSSINVILSGVRSFTEGNYAGTREAFKTLYIQGAVDEFTFIPDISGGKAILTTDFIANKSYKKVGYYSGSSGQVQLTDDSPVITLDKYGKVIKENNVLIESTTEVVLYEGVAPDYPILKSSLIDFDTIIVTLTSSAGYLLYGSQGEITLNETQMEHIRTNTDGSGVFAGLILFSAVGFIGADIRVGLQAIPSDYFDFDLNSAFSYTRETDGTLTKTDATENVAITKIVGKIWR